MMPEIEADRIIHDIRTHVEESQRQIQMQIQELRDLQLAALKARRNELIANGFVAAIFAALIVLKVIFG